MIRLLATPAAVRLAWCLVHFLWQGALLGLLAWGALAALRGRSPRLRYAVACAFLAFCALAPFATFLVLAPSAAPAGAALPGLSGPGLGSAGTVFVMPAGGSAAWEARLVACFPGLLLGWMLGCGLLGLRAGGGWLWLQLLRRRAEPVVEDGWPERVRELAARAGIRRAVRLLRSARVRTPMALGLLRPVILVPLGFFAQVDAAGAEAVLAHELAHLRRLDPLVNGLQCAVETLLFFHPAVHFISRRVRTERECCCDDDAVLACGDAVLYVETLCRLDASRGRPLSPALSARGGSLMERIQRLLAPIPAPRLAMPGLAAGLLSLGATVVLAQTPAPLPPSPPSAVPAPPAPPAPPRAVKAPAPPAALPGDPIVHVSKPSLHEALAYLASARKLNLLIDQDVADVKTPISLLDCPWSQAMEALLRTHQLGIEMHGNVMRVAKDWRLRSEAPRPAAPAPTAAPQPAPPEAKAAPAAASATTTYLPPRRILFVMIQGKDGAGRMRIDARRATREELLEALRKIEHLARGGAEGNRLTGEWTLPSMKDEGARDLLTFELDGVTTQSVRELYK